MSYTRQTQRHDRRAAERGAHRSAAPTSRVPEPKLEPKSDDTAEQHVIRRGVATIKKGLVHPLMWAIFAAMMLPVELSMRFGTVTLSPFKLIMVLVTIPVLYLFFKNRLLHWLDGLFAAYALYTIMCIFINRGLTAIEPSGVFFLETIVAYAAARVSMRELPDLKAVLMMFIRIIIILGILAIPEAILHTRFLHNAAEALTGIGYDHATDTRFNMLRANATFEHPILFGLAAASLATYAWIIARDTHQGILLLLGLGNAVFFSLSSAAYLVFILQIGILIFERATRSIPYRWTIVMISVVSILIFLSLASDRGPIGLIASYLTFSAHTGYYRMLIWEHGIDDVLANPIFGIKPETWTRPIGMTNSIDNHWLITMMKGGIPSLIMLFSFILIAAAKVQSRPDAPPPSEEASEDMPVHTSLRASETASRPSRHRDRSAAKREPRQSINTPLDVRHGWVIVMFCLFLGGATVTFFGQMIPIYSIHLAIGVALITQTSHSMSPIKTPGHQNNRLRLRRSTA